MEIRRLGPHLGVEVTGVDVKKLDDETFGAIYRAWLDHNVLCVRGQDLDIDEYLAYSRRFGYVEPHPSKSTRHPDSQHVTLLGANKFDADGKLNMRIYKRGAEGWHTDGSYNDNPFKATQLYAVAIPSRGGDTLFASTYAAYERLPDGLKKRIEGLKGAYVYGGRKKRDSLLDPEDRNRKPAIHPLVRTHSETGRKVLYFDPNKLLYIEGLPEAESDALIEELKGHMVEPGTEYRHKWAKGDIVIWDNRCSYHWAAGDYPPEEERIHWRVSICEPARAA